jgi:hypothetical protein
MSHCFEVSRIPLLTSMIECATVKQKPSPSISLSTSFQISPHGDWIIITMSQLAWNEATLDWFTQYEKIAADSIEKWIADGHSCLLLQVVMHNASIAENAPRRM